MRERHVPGGWSHGNEKTMSVVQKIFGTHSEREIKRINGLVDKIEGMRPEMMELTDHPFFIGTQGHPELKSRPNRAHPLFGGFVHAAVGV